MMNVILGDILLRSVPPELRAGVADKTLTIFGSVIRNASNGQITGFLQEAAPLEALIQPLAKGQLGSATPLGLPMQLAGLAQGEAIRAGVGRLEAGVQLLTQLGVADVALGAAGLGVSAIGFTVMAVKIDQVKTAVKALSGEIEAVSAKLDALQQDAIDNDFSDLHSLSKAFDEGWRLSDGAAVRTWQDVAQGALQCQSRFELRANRALSGGIDHYFEADPFLDAVSLSSALRVAALMSCNETPAAQAAAVDGARSLERMTGAIGMADLSLARLSLMDPEPGSEAWTLAQAEANQAARVTAQKIRSREASAATRAAPLATLQSHNISPRDWLEAARHEEHSPFLILLADGGQGWTRSAEAINPSPATN